MAKFGVITALFILACCLGGLMIVERSWTQNTVHSYVSNTRTDLLVKSHQYYTTVNKSSLIFYNNSHSDSNTTSLNQKLNILVVFGTRPEMIKIAPIIWEYEKFKDSKYSNISISSLFTNQHSDLVNDGILAKLHINKYIKFRLHLNDLNRTNNRKVDRLSYITSQTILGLSEILNDYKNIFNLILVQGDTTSAMSAALCVYYHFNSPKHKIYLGHIEAGLRSYNTHSPYPEEINRQFISKMANIHFAPTFYNQVNLIKENILPKQVIITGNTVVDFTKYIYNNKQFENEFENTYCNTNNNNNDTTQGFVTSDFDSLRLICDKNINASLKFALFTMHRREKKQAIVNSTSNVNVIVDNILTAIYQLLIDYPTLHIFYPIHPSQTMIYRWIQLKKTNKQKKHQVANRFHLIKPLSPTLMPFIYKKISIIITDSGGIQEEITALNNKLENKYIPVLVIRDTTERPEIVQTKQAYLVGYETDQILQYAKQILNRKNQPMLDSYFPFGDGTASQTIMQTLATQFDAIVSNSPISGGLVSIENHNHSNAHVQSSHPVSSFYDKLSELKFIQNSSNELTGHLLVVLTVWKRNNTYQQLDAIFDSSILPDYIVIFQNEQHINIDIANMIDYVSTKYPTKFNKNNPTMPVKGIFHIHSTNFNTKYMARFFVTLMFNCDYWIVFDDDYLPGSNVIKNHLRVVQHYNALSTQNGRYIKSYDDNMVWMHNIGDLGKNKFDRQVDFGGHIWSGKTIWIRDAITYETPQITIQTGEDMTLSAILYVHYGIATICPKQCIVHNQTCQILGGNDRFASYKTGSRKLYYQRRASIAKYWIERRGWQTLALGQTRVKLDPVEARC